MKSVNIQELLRPNIRGIAPYSSARSEFSGTAEVFLDANENFRDFLGKQRNRYPDPFQRELKKRVGEMLKVSPDRLFLGNGSDEAIDLLYRAFAVPGKDKAVILPPTYGVYKVFADLNDIEVVKVQLQSDFSLDVEGIRRVASEEKNLKILFLCSPNNPTGNSAALEDIEEVIQFFPGIVAVDEAYQDFSSSPSALSLLDRYENLVVLRTFSKGWGMANVRLGMAASSPEVARVLQNIKYPYNLSGPAQEEAFAVLEDAERVASGIQEIIRLREELIGNLKTVPYVGKIYPSDANFLLIQVGDATRLHDLLMEQGVIIRNRTHEPGCSGCVRITVGSAEENKKLIEAMRDIADGGAL